MDVILSDHKMVRHKSQEKVSSRSKYLTLNVLEMYVLYSCVIHQGQLKVIDGFLYGGVEHVFRSFLPEQIQYLSHSVKTYDV